MSFEKILIVEDDLVIRNLLQSIFKRHKLTVTLADSLAQASGLLAREQFDLMLLDLRLPDGDGLKFLEQISTIPSVRSWSWSRASVPSSRPSPACGPAPSITCSNPFLPARSM